MGIACCLYLVKINFGAARAYRGTIGGARCGLFTAAFYSYSCGWVAGRAGGVGEGEGRDGGGAGEGHKGGGGRLCYSYTW